MGASYTRGGYNYRMDDRERDLYENPPSLQERFGPVVERVRAKLYRLRTSRAERSLFVNQCSQAVRRALPWPPILEVVIIVLWIWQLNWGESHAFTRAVSQCQWSDWESWPSGATPYRIALVADPQLVDPHTYPGRPWPLSTLTVKHTDQYLRRSFENILGTLHPSSVLFLGDLFDGGREWSTPSSQSPEEQYRKFGDKYWLSEYVRFGRIFVDPWLKEITAHGGDRSRLQANMPGNHDLGFANGVQLAVRKRWSLYFGDGNQIQVLGNHTFVSIDSVSLSAKGGQQDEHSKAIWEPTDQFLNGAKAKKAEVIRREQRTVAQQNENRLLPHVAIDAGQYKHGADEKLSATGGADDLPTVLLTHVPLYRNPGTPCGPLREKYPPSKSTNPSEPLESDEPNALKVQGGYQYQNVLHPDITKEIVEKIGGITHVFSGDDHDYCEVVHRGYTSRGGGIREITVKSLSWAMGVRHPGFLLVSLWNPLDQNAKASPQEQGTVQSHLCLMPDQLGIFLSYGKLLLFTVIALVAQAAYFTIRGRDEAWKQASILPLDELPSSTAPGADGIDEPMSCSSSAHSSDGTSANLRANSNRGRTGLAPHSSGYSYQKADKPGSNFDIGSAAFTRGHSQAPTRRRLFLWHLWRSFRMVAVLSLGWYIHLMRSV